MTLVHAKRRSRSRLKAQGSRLKAGRKQSLQPRASSLQLPATRDVERYLVGGVNSPVRAFRHVGGDPLVLSRSRGAEVFSDRGERLIDFIMGWGALILGHDPPSVVCALRQGLAKGALMGLTHPAEVELARLIAEAVPSVEQVRFTVSGTEACMTAIKLARAHTGRTKIVTCDGCYHGHSDSLMARTSAGIPHMLARETLSVAFNDFEALDATLQRHHDELAAVIVEPVAANMGVVLPQPDFLRRIRALTSRHGILLIFDEVVTGFRVGYAGAQGFFGVTPDLTTFGKIIGGGLPIGALGGPRRLMQRLSPDGDVYHGGTFAGHPLSMAAGIATLRGLAAHLPYDSLERFSRRLIEGLVQLAARYDVPVRINRLGSMWTLFFSQTPVCNFAQARMTRRDQFAQWATVLRRRGILVPPSPLEAVFLSTAHTERHIGQFLGAARDAFAAIRSGAEARSR